MMRPKPRSVIVPSTACAVLATPRRFTSSICRKTSGPDFMNGAETADPALAIIKSTGPQRSTASRTARCTASASVTSAMAAAWASPCAIACSSDAGLRPVMVTVAPAIATVHDKSYPLARSLLVYTLGEPQGALQAYVGWLLSDAGQKIVEETGYVPLPPDQRVQF